MRQNVLSIFGVLGALLLAGALVIFASNGIAQASRLSNQLLQVAAGQAQVAVDEVAAEGILVAFVEPDGPAAQAGVKRGDILLTLGGEALTTFEALRDALAAREPGDSVELELLHGDERRTLTVTLGERHDHTYLGLVPCGPGHEAGFIRMAAPGALVAAVQDGSPAAEAGMQAGDIILEVDGQAPAPEQTLSSLITAHQPGDSIVLKIQRRGAAEPLDITVTLGEHPEHAGQPFLGITVPQMLHFDRFVEGALPPGVMGTEPFRFDTQIQGGVVMQVSEGSPAAAAGVQQGDVITALNGESVADLHALRNTLTALQPGDTLSLTLRRPGEEAERTVEVRLGAHPDDATRAYLGVDIGPFLFMRRMGEGEFPALPELHDELIPFEGAPLPFMEMPALPPLEAPEGEQL